MTKAGLGRVGVHQGQGEMIPSEIIEMFIAAQGYREYRPASVR